MVEIKHGWQCPSCLKLHSEPGLAEACYDSHIEYKIECDYALSNPFPINIKVTETRGDDAIQWLDYKPQGKPIEVRK